MAWDPNWNPNWRLGRPFRFLDLPRKARYLVYKELFNGTFLSAGPLCQDLGYAKTVHGEEGRQLLPTSALMNSPIVFQSGRLPDVLMVSKFVRTEALPVFSESITLFMCSGDDEMLRRIPKDYLAATKWAILQRGCPVRIDKILMPELRTLQLFLGSLETAWYPKIPSRKQLSLDILKDFEDNRAELFYGIDELLKEGIPPFRILVSYESGTREKGKDHNTQIVGAR